MRDPKTWQRARALGVLITGLLGAGLIAAGCGEEDGGTTPATTQPEATTAVKAESADEPAEPAGEKAEKQGSAGAGGGSAGRGITDRVAVAAAESSYRDYVDAINALDGTRLCSLLNPSFQNELELPAPRGSCPERLTASLGYADPSGAPVWKATELSGIESAILGEGGRVQLSASITTHFADRGEPSIESDIAFLEPVDPGRNPDYRLMKAPGSLWRAVGQPDIPPSVVTPPEGF